MNTDKRVMAVCDEAGVEVRTGSMILITMMCWIYTAIHSISEVTINLFR